MIAHYTANILWQKSRKYRRRIVPLHPRLRELLHLFTGSMRQDDRVFPITRQRAWQPFLNTQGGFLYFTEQVPVPESSQFNFTFSFGAGVQAFRGARALTLGYKFHHISNAQTGHYNPGIDSNLFYFGWSFLR